MIDNHLVGRYQRLWSELEAVRSEAGGSAGRAERIDRVRRELADIERALAVQRLGARLIGFDEDRAGSGASTRLAPV